MKFLSFISLLFFFFVACTSRPVEPTRSSRHTIDTLFNQKTILLKPEMDSACGMLSKRIFTTAVDSIMKVRQLDMNILVE